MEKAIKFFALLLGVSALIGFSYQLISTKLDEKHYPPPGELVDIGGYRLHMHCMGSGSPAVILDAGGGSDSLDWNLVQQQIATFTKVCSYDRAGLGWSDRGPSKRTSREIVNELHSLLQKSNISPPYVFVGHSFGGVNIRLYASTYPNEVAGLVLVDASNEDQIKRMKGMRKITFTERFWTKIEKYGAPFGIVRLMNRWGKPPAIFQSFPQSYQNEYIAKMSSTKHIQTGIAENNEFFEESLQELSQANRSLGSIPLIVIRRGHKGGNIDAADWQVWKELQNEVAERSTRGRLEVAENSDHMIPWE